MQNTPRDMLIGVKVTEAKTWPFLDNDLAKEFTDLLVQNKPKNYEHN